MGVHLVDGRDQIGLGIGGQGGQVADGRADQVDRSLHLAKGIHGGGGGAQNLLVQVVKTDAQQVDQSVVDVRVIVQGGGDFAQRVEGFRGGADQVGNGLAERTFGGAVSVDDGNDGFQCGDFGVGAESLNHDSASAIEGAELEGFLGGVEPDAASGSRNRVGSQALNAQVLDEAVLSEGNAVKLGECHSLDASKGSVFLASPRHWHPYRVATMRLRDSSSLSTFTQQELLCLTRHSVSG